MSGFESCCVASRHELRRRLFIVVLLALTAIVADSSRQPADRAEVLSMPTEMALDELVDLGIGPDGEALRPEDIVTEAQKALAQGLEARP